MITIHQLCYNEIKILEFAYQFYKIRFPNAKFILHDNGSTDGSKELAVKLGYEIRPFETNNQMDEATQRDLRNNCWKNDNTDWVLVADMDELIDIDEEELLQQQSLNKSIIKTWGYQMINLNNEFNLEGTIYGFRENEVYDKSLIFNKNHISDMNWSVGSHLCSPVGSLVSYSDKNYNLLHFKYLGENYLVNRYKELNDRQSQQNKNNKWCYHYNTEEAKIRNYYQESLKKSLYKLV
jgi:glycosyltransferase involved in cell wall biosynthesis